MLGDWGKNLTKTPILVLFIVLISMGVGTASALITITLAGDVHVLGEMKIDETLLMGTDNPNDDDGIRFDDGSEVLFWDESEDSFMVTDDLVTQGDLKTVGDLRVGTDDGFGDDKICMDGPDCKEFIMWDDSKNQFALSDSIVTGVVIQAGNSESTLGYNRIGLGTPDNNDVSGSNDLFVMGSIETDGTLYADGDIYVGTENGEGDDIICMDGPNCSEFLTWDNSETRFQLSDALVIEGAMQVGNDGGADVFYNRIGIGTAETLEGADDLFVTDEIELDGNLFADGDIWVGTDSSSDRDNIIFDDGTKTLSWDNAQSRFEFNEQLGVDELFIGNDNVDHDIEFFVGGNPSGERFQWDVSADAFEVSDDFTVFGKLTVTGLIDPPAITFSAETHDSIKQLAIGVSDHEEVMQFWNGDNNRFEVYVILQDAFYTLDGKEVKYKSTGIPENSAVNRLAEFEEQEKARLANPEVEESNPEIEE